MKKCQLIIASVAVVGAFAAVPASAQFYLGIGFGQSHVSGGSGGGTYLGVPYTTSGFDSNKTTFQFNGGFQFDENWGIEVQYTDLGGRDGTIRTAAGVANVSDLKAYQFGIAGTGTYMFDQNWFVRGKLGVSSNHIDTVHGTIAGVAFSVGGGTKTDVLAGLGVGYQWNKNLGTRLEYEYYGKFDGGPGSEPKGSNLGLRMQYRF